MPGQPKVQGVPRTPSRNPACSSTQGRRPISKVRCATASNGPNGSPASLSPTPPDAVRIKGSLPSIATMDAVRPISIGVRSFSLIWRRLRASFEIDAEWPALDHHAARAHLVERAQHASLTPQRLVRQTDDQPVRRCDRGGRANLSCDRYFVAMRIEQTGGGESTRGRAADAGVTMPDQRRPAVPAAAKIHTLFDMLPPPLAQPLHLFTLPINHTVTLST